MIRWFLLLCLILPTTVYCEENRRVEIHYDLRNFLDQIKAHRDTVRDIYLNHPKQGKLEKIELAKREYFHASALYDKSREILSEYAAQFKDTPLIKILDAHLTEAFDELKSYAVFITKMHPLELYARNYRLKPGKLLKFRKFRNVNDNSMIAGSELIATLKEAYQQFHLRTKTTLLKAESLLLPVVKSYPDFLPAAFWLSRIYFELNRIDESREIVQKLLEVDPSLAISKCLDGPMLAGDDLIAYAQAFPETELPKEIKPVQLERKEKEQEASPLIQRVPFVFSVDNSSLARPQAGLNQAEIVYEMPVEGGITRLLLVIGNIHKLEHPIGPIRSMRGYFLQQVYFMNPFFVHCGASPGGLKVKEELDFYTHDELGVYPTFWRDDAREKPHNLFTSLSRLKEVAYIRKKVWEDPDMVLRTKPTGYPFLENTVKNVHIPFYSGLTVSYQYDGGLAGYRRRNNGVVHLDSDGEPVIVKNLIVQLVDEQVIDKEGRRSISVLGEGEMFAFAMGKAFHGKWIHRDVLTPVIYLDDEGKEVAFPEGNTWIHFLSSKRKPEVEYESPRP